MRRHSCWVLIQHVHQLLVVEEALKELAYLAGSPTLGLPSLFSMPPLSLNFQKCEKQPTSLIGGERPEARWQLQTMDMSSRRAKTWELV